MTTRTAHEQDVALYLWFAVMAIAVLLVALVLVKTVAPAPEAANVSSPVEVVCMEDMDCWTCSANDNRPCVDGKLVTK